MMKKVLVLLTVLAVASVASAVTTVDLVITSLNGAPIDPVTEITITESDWIAFDVVMTATELNEQWIALDVIVSVDGAGTLDVSEYTRPPVWDFGFHREPREIIPGKSYEFAEAEFNGVPAGVALDHILLHCDQGEPANDVYVTIGPGTFWWDTQILPDYGLPDEWNGIVVHNVPEPVTVVLVGLGGLLLVRRRR